MQVTIPHEFTKDEALRRVKQALDQARAQMSEQATIEEERWDGDVLTFAFSAQGQHITGTFTVKEKEFDLYAKLPLMLRLFEGKIEAAIKEQAQKMIGK